MKDTIPYCYFLGGRNMVRVGIMVREVHEFARVEEYGKN